jgi:ferredoxin-NADP reductase
MSDLFTAHAASSVLAFVTTLHLGLTALRNHRRQSGTAGILLVAVSVCFVAMPWLLPSPAGIAIGLVAHAAWFVACERLRGSAEREKPAMIGEPSAATRRGTRPARTSASTRRFTELQVLAVVDETPDIRTFRLARPAGLTFLPGQFLTVRLQIDGRDATRCYSISSSPQATAYLEISVRRQGVVSGVLHASIRPGATLQVMGPLGSFVYPAGDDRPLVLIAGGVGITPVASMVRHALATEPSRPVTLIYSARSDREFAFRDEWQSLAKRHAQFQVFFASSATADPSVYPGRVDRALLAAAAPRLVQSIVCMCGDRKSVV